MKIQKQSVPMVLNLLVWILGFYLFIVLMVYLFQSKLLYFPDRNLVTNPNMYGLKYEEVYFETSDKIRIHGWYVPADSAKYTLLFCHGNAGNISHRMESIKQFHELGLNVLIFDYRGYGKSEGSISEEGTYLDVKAAWDYLINKKKIPVQKIIIFGRSLGAAIACDLATHQKPAALILESAFTSVPDLAAKIYPFLPVRWLSKFKYNNLQKIKTIQCPILIIHSKYDEIIPFSHGKKLFEAANFPKQFVEISGSHNDGFFVSEEMYKSNIIKFLELVE